MLIRAGGGRRTMFIRAGGWKGCAKCEVKRTEAESDVRSEKDRSGKGCVRCKDGSRKGCAKCDGKRMEAGKDVRSVK